MHELLMTKLLIEHVSFFSLVLPGVIARHPVYLPYLRQALTADAVETYFAHLFTSSNGTNVERCVYMYE